VYTVGRDRSIRVWKLGQRQHVACREEAHALGISALALDSSNLYGETKGAHVNTIRLLDVVHWWTRQCGLYLGRVDK
jgi:hypothetical protein